MKKYVNVVLLASLTANLLVLGLGVFWNQQEDGRLNISALIISVFSRARSPSGETYQLISLLDERLRIHGLPWFHEDKPFLGRLPKRIKDKIRPRLWELAKRPSGGRIRFKTDSNTIGVQATCSDLSLPHHMTRIMRNGIDLYVNDFYAGSAFPNQAGELVAFWSIDASTTIHHITLYLPLYGAIRVTNILVEQNAQFEVADDFPETGPIVYYGSSITQGASASNPGLSYPAILSRRLGVDFVNLGFAGNGLGDSDIAQLIAEIECAAVVLDYWANPSPDVYKQTLPHFVDIIRARHKNIPILIVGPFYTLKQKSSQEEKLRIAYEFVQQRQAEGDRNILFVEGETMISEETAYGLIDGIHCNSLGFWFCANALEPVLKDALNRNLSDRHTIADESI